MFHTVHLAPENEAINKQCLADFYHCDPRIEKTRIERSKDSLLQDSYVWILHDRAFKHWRDNSETQLLWIKGDPGKGKTMLIIGLIKELSKQLESEQRSSILPYFFCQGTDSRLNKAVFILKGLIYRLVDQQEILIQHLLKRYNPKQGRFSEGTESLYALWTILSDMLNDPSLSRVYLMVDALDECDSELSQLLDLIALETSKASSQVKWLVSSRNRPDIKDRLGPDNLRLKIDLELNQAHISRAVNTFIDFKVSELAKRGYTSQLQEKVSSYLHENAEDTFLWVALVCKELQNVQVRKTLSVLRDFPPKLESLYERILKQIDSLQDTTDARLCERILSSVTLAYRPIYLKELVATAGLQENPDDLQSINELIDLCGSFLIVRDEIIYFVHQSVKDYFSTGKGSRIFSSGIKEGHREIAFRSLKVMSDTLRKNICGLNTLGALPDKARNVNQDSLTQIQYACCYWVSHLCDDSHNPHNQIDLCDGGEVHVFLEKHFLHWLEALSLMGNISTGVLMTIRLESMLKVSKLILIIL